MVEVVPRKLGPPGDPAPTFPVETLRHWYVTPFGGLSSDVGLFQVGINREALERNTTLDPSSDLVRVTVLGRRRRPILFDRFFEVVPLDERHPDALKRSPMGEAVLPEGDQVMRPRESPHPGDEVILSSAASQRLGLLADSEAFAGVVQELFRARRELDPENS
jgi:hypothetical protein